MRCLDARVDGDAAATEEPWEGEPPAVLNRRTPADLIQELESDLSRADVLRIVDRQWLASEEIGQHVEALVAAFRARGGLVEFG